MMNRDAVAIYFKKMMEQKIGMMNHDAVAIDIKNMMEQAEPCMIGMMNHDAVAIDIKKMMEQEKPCVTDECCIYKVPIHIRRLNQDAYTPQFVSIGPFHHNRHPHLQNMEKYKITYCKEFFERTATLPDEWICHLEKVEPRIRRCYSDTLEFSKEELVKIIFVDSAFIFEFFLKIYMREIGDTNNFPLNPNVSAFILRDLVILENQLPFFVLEDLFNLSLLSSVEFGVFDANITSFLKLSIDVLQVLKTSHLPSHDYFNISIRHFTDLVRSFYLKHPPKRGPRTISDESMNFYPVNYFPSASELSEAGLRFKVNKERCCILDLKFSGRVLEIPQLDVDDVFTEVSFRNILALEQFLYPFEAYVTEYVRVLDRLVNTSKDVDIMVRQEILINWLWDTDSVTKLINGLTQNIIIYDSSPSYSRISKKLNAFYRNRWNKWKSTLKRDYCSSPWQTAATIAAIILLILSLVQSVCSVLQVL